MITKKLRMETMTISFTNTFILTTFGLSFKCCFTSIVFTMAYYRSNADFPLLNVKCLLLHHTYQN